MRYTNSLIVFLLIFFILDENKFASAAQTSSGLLIPLYIDPPSTSWDKVVLVKTAHPSVPMIVIANPDNGPEPFNPNYIPAIKQLQSLGIAVLGYVHTNYGARNYTEMTGEISEYKNWYGVNGILFDEMAYKPGNETLYSNLSNYSRSIGLGYTAGNPGTDTSPSYIGTVDNIVIYENSSLPTLSTLGGWHTSYAKGNFSFASYGINSLDRSFVENATNYVGYIYATNDTLPNPWGVVSPYLDNISSFLPLGATLGVRSVDTAGNSIQGVSVGIKFLGDDLARGVLPFNFALNDGQQYNVTVPQHFGNYTFDHWQDNSSFSYDRTVLLSGNTTLVAVYRDSICAPPASGDWTVSSSCTLGADVVSAGNVIVENNSILTIPDGIKLVIDFIYHHLFVQAGSGVLIKAGGAIN